MKAAQKMLGVPTIGVGSVWSGGGGRELKEANMPSCRPKYIKRRQNVRFSALLDLKIAENIVFRSKVLNKMYSQDGF
jgi:hypothetical protein